MRPKAAAAAAALAVLVQSAPGHARAPAEAATFLFLWRGAPVGKLSLTWEPGSSRFTYASQHFFPRALGKQSTAWRRDFTVDGSEVAPLPEAFWLWRSPHPGCRKGFDERSGVSGELCADAWHGDVLTGRVLDQRFTASYLRGELQSLDLPDATFVRARAPAVAPDPPDVFGAGLRVRGRGGPLGLSPPVAPPAEPPLAPWSLVEAERLARALHSRAGPDLDVRGCVALAQDFVRAAQRSGHEAAWVAGLVLDGDRAFPHAWVRVKDESGHLRDLDPALLAPVTPETHLPLAVATTLEPSMVAGGVYVQLFSGVLQVVRRQRE